MCTNLTRDRAMQQNLDFVYQSSQPLAKQRSNFYYITTSKVFGELELFGPASKSVLPTPVCTIEILIKPEAGS